MIFTICYDFVRSLPCSIEENWGYLIRDTWNEIPFIRVEGPCAIGINAGIGTQFWLPIGFFYANETLAVVAAKSLRRCLPQWGV